VRVEIGAVPPVQPLLTPNNDTLTRVDKRATFSGKKWNSQTGHPLFCIPTFLSKNYLKTPLRHFCC
jgi:hypothetical protein